MLGKTGGYWTWLFNIGWRLVVLDLPNTVCEKLSVIYKRCVQRDGYDPISRSGDITQVPCTVRRMANPCERLDYLYKGNRQLLRRSTHC